MKEKQFKQKISEIASRIAESESVDADLILDKISQSHLNDYFNAIDTASKFTDLLKGLHSMMPNLEPKKAISGMNSFRSYLSNELANSNNSEPVDKKNPNAMYNDMPDKNAPKNESFARMVKLANLKD